jgi:hypothetical protein
VLALANRRPVVPAPSEQTMASREPSLLSRLTAHLPADDLLELLKHPNLSRDERASIRAELAKRLGLSARSHWDLVRQLYERSEFDLRSPLKTQSGPPPMAASR